jgi:hypothetical protein
VQIVGVDADSPYAMRIKERFSKRAVPPETVARQIVAAIQKNRFMVLTSFDVKLLYFAKRKLFPLYHHVMIRISRMLNQAKG